ncbi:unnamed protein product [Absidia cylindrospora]
MATAPQRILLASLIVSTKLIHDTSPKNKHWKEFASNYFELNEINLMEKQFLTLMDFNLSISKADFQNAVNWYQRCCNIHIKACRWRRQDDSPNRLVVVAPSQNMVALEVTNNSNSKKKKDNAIVNKKVPPPPPSPTSTSSSSSLQSISISNTPTFDHISTNDISSAYSPLGTIHVNRPASCDAAVGSTWSHPTTFVTPLFSV